MADNLEVKAIEVNKKVGRNAEKRRGDKKERAPRENKEKKEHK